METKLTRSQKKFIRIKKAQIRNKFWDVKRQAEEIAKLYKKSESQITLAEKKPKKKVVSDKNKKANKKSKK